MKRGLRKAHKHKKQACSNFRIYSTSINPNFIIMSMDMTL